MKTPPKITDVCGPAAYEAMLDEIAEECCDPQNPGCVALLGCNNDFNGIYDDFVTGLADVLGYFDKEESLKEARRAAIQIEGYNVDGVSTGLEPSFANRHMTELLCDLHHKGQKKPDGTWGCRPRELRAVVSLYQDLYNRERFLSIFTSRCPEVRVYFVNLIDPETETITNKIVQRDGNVETLFRSYADLEALPELDDRIDGICSDEEITAVGALPGHRKTFTLLQVVRSLLTGAPLFGHFEVKSKAEKVIYLTPESAARPFYKRLKLLGLDEFIKSRSLLIRELQMGPISLDDPNLLEAVKGADVFLDTLVRFSDGDENDASDMRLLSEKLFALQKAGARSIWFSHHSVKASNGNSEMSLESAMRGSGDLGAMIANCYALRQLDRQRGTVYVQCVKRRDGQEVLPFIVEGLELRMTKKPGEVGSINEYVGKPGPKADPGKEEKLQMILDLTEQGKTREEIAQHLGVSLATVKRWKKEAETDAGRPQF
jgi:hypothetical protein